MTRTAVIGAGAWGTALAGVLRRNGQEVTIWALEPDVAMTIDREHENHVYLPGVRLDPGIRATNEIDRALSGAEAVLLVVPAQHLREICSDARPHWPGGAPAVVCAKGIEEDTGALMSEVAAETLPDAPVAVLSGPTFAGEVAQGLPTAVTLAGTDAALAKWLVPVIGGPLFRPYAGDDPVGAQVGGAVKNVIAIACGIVQGKKLGENARAALITRGLAEMVRLGAAKGARPETLMGLSGLGDLTLTCNSLQSRNLSVGVALGAGESLEAHMKSRRSVAEGVWTSKSVVWLANRMKVDMPISQAVEAILHKGADIDETVESLLARPFKTE